MASWRTVEHAIRMPTAHRYVMAWMAALSMAAGLSADCYLVELTAACAMHVASPEEQS